MEIALMQRARSTQRGAGGKVPLTAPELGSVLGRLLVAGFIDRRAFEAGQRFEELYTRFHMLKGLPRPTVPAADLNAGRGMALRADPSQEAVERVARELASTVKLCRSIHVRAWQAVYDCCVRDEEVIQPAVLSKALSALADHWGMGVDFRKKVGS